MVTLKNNFGVEPDKDSVYPKDMNVSEGSPNDAKSPGPGHAKAILSCRKNSRPFQVRTLVLDTPAKIGRSVARARPSSNNGIFDCKVLSRNHALIWYDYDTGKFLIQDTKSSNGTFVNNHRLSKGGETSLPREFFSRDVVQFGVDVLENQRKGNEESENSDTSNHIVTHGCIMATVRLIHPNGKECKPGLPCNTPSPMMPIPQEKICKLELIIHEAQQREERLHDKLDELQLIIMKLEGACQEALTNRFEETRLLAKIESLEKQMMGKIVTGTGGKAPEKVEGEIQQLLVDLERVQSVAREIQERQHRKLLESEQKLVEAQRVASNLELEVIALREQASLSESHLQDMGAKCTTYCQTIDTLKSNFHAQIELTQKLEAEVAKLEKREAERDLNVCFSDVKILDKYKFITEEAEEDMLKKYKENQEAIFGWCKNYEESDKIEEKDFINEDDKTEWLTKKLENLADAVSNGLEHISTCTEQLESSFVDVEKSRKSLEQLCVKKHELSLQLESARIPMGENEKTEDELDGEKREFVKPVILSSLSNEKITELENELKEQEELMSKERLKQKELEGKCSRLRCELEMTIKHCKKLNLASCSLKTLLRNHLKDVEDSASACREKVVKLESEMEELERGRDEELVNLLASNKKNKEAKETQTSSVPLTSSSTNTDSVEREPVASGEWGGNQKEPQERGESSPSQFPNDATDLVDNCKKETSSLDNSSLVETIEDSNLKNVNLKVKSEKDVKTPEETTKAEPPWASQNLGVWEKIQKLQSLFSHQPSPDVSPPFSSAQVTEMKSLLNLITEDLVYLLLREQQMRKDKQSLQEKLDRSGYAKDVSALGLAVHLKTIVLFSVTAVVAYFLYLSFS